MTRGEAHRIIDAHLLELSRKKLHADEYGIPLYVVHDTGMSIDILFHDTRVDDISVDYVPVPPYVFDTETDRNTVSDEMPGMWEGTV